MSPLRACSSPTGGRHSQSAASGTGGGTKICVEPVLRQCVGPLAAGGQRILARFRFHDAGNRRTATLHTIFRSFGLGGQAATRARFEGSYLERQFQAGVRFTFQTRRSPVAPEGAAGDNSCATLSAHVSSRRHRYRRLQHRSGAAVAQRRRGAHWAQIRLQQDGGNRDGLGAWIGVERAKQPTLWRRIRTDGSYLSAGDVRAHFGLGSSGSAGGVVVRWPDGTRERWRQLDGDRVTTLRRGTGKIEAGATNR